MKYWEFEPVKAIEAILYLANHLDAMDQTWSRIYALLFLADVRHLYQWGRFICGSTYLAGEQSPVPHEISHLLRGLIKGCYATEGEIIVCERLADTQHLSESDTQIMDELLEETRDMGLDMVQLLSCSKPYQLALGYECRLIKIEDIAAALPNSSELLDYLQGRL